MLYLTQKRYVLPMCVGLACLLYSFAEWNLGNLLPFQNDWLQNDPCSNAYCSILSGYRLKKNTLQNMSRSNFLLPKVVGDPSSVESQVLDVLYSHPTAAFEPPKSQPTYVSHYQKCGVGDAVVVVGRYFLYWIWCRFHSD